MRNREDAPIVTIIKQAIEQSGLSVAELSRLTGIDHGQLSRFVRGERDLTLGTTAKLFPHLGLEVVATKRRRKS